MVDYPGRKRLEVEAGDFVCADHHGAALAAEGVDEHLHGIFGGIDVVAVELESKTPAIRVLQGGVPVAAYAVPGGVLGYIDELVVAEEGFDYVHGAVGRIVVHHDDVVREIGLLAECAPDGVPNGLDAVPAGDDHRGFVLEVAFAKVDFLEFGGQPAAYSLEMRGTGLFHFDLDLPVPWVHVIEQFLAAQAFVAVGLVIKELSGMHQPAYPGSPEPQVVQTGELVIPVHLRGSGLEDTGAVELNPAEVEIVPQGPFLIFYDRYGFAAVEMVGIQHGGHGVVGYLDHALEAAVNEAEGCRAGVQEGVIGIRLNGSIFDCSGAEVRESENFHSFHVSKLKN